MTSLQVPSPSSWDERSKSIYPMPGGYSEYLASFRILAVWVDEQSASSEELIECMCDTFGISETSARPAEAFLRKSGLLESDAGILVLNDLVRQWLSNGEDWIPIAILHSRVRFVGELLEQLLEPRNAEELRAAAANYGLEWTTQAPVNFRRGWLQSANLIEPTGRRLRLTDAGKELLAHLQTHDPSTADNQVQQSTSDHEPTEGHTGPTDIDQLAEEIVGAAIDSGNSARFERAVRDAFNSMGFVAKHLGGPGQTDVLLTAPLGKDQSYRVAVDAKTTSSGSVSDAQVDWVTLRDHRKKHDATYSLLVGPNPSNKRLIERAIDHEVAVLSSEVLADLCRQHAHAPLSLLDYREVFDAKGEVNLDSIELKAEQHGQLRQLAAVLCVKLAERTQTLGRMSARDLHVLLVETAFEGTSESDIERLLEMLSHPLVGATDGCPKTGYVLATSLSMCAARLQLLGDEIVGGVGVEL